MAVIIFPIVKPGVIFLSHILKILSQFSNISLISSDSAKELITSDIVPLNSDLFFVKYSPKQNILLKIFNYICWQIDYSIYILRIYRKIDIFIFFINGDYAILPIVICTILQKPVVLLIAGSTIKAAKFSKDLLYIPIIFITGICRYLTSYIVLYSPLLIYDYQLHHYRHKILIAGEHFLDFTTFTVTIPHADRPPLIGYIGRLSAEKGVQHFVQALPVILSNQQGLRALIGGDGQLKAGIEASLQKSGIADRVDLPGWIPHEDLPKYLNQLRLLVLPSYTEGLPNIMLEAMACGTPVLATPVGAIPDVIRDGETGFIMENNSPECIARNVLRALSYPDLEGVAERGRRLIGEEYTFEKAVERWREILNQI